MAAGAQLAQILAIDLDIIHVKHWSSQLLIQKWVSMINPSFEKHCQKYINDIYQLVTTHVLVVLVYFFRVGMFPREVFQPGFGQESCCSSSRLEDLFRRVHHLVEVTPSVPGPEVDDPGAWSRALSNRITQNLTWIKGICSKWISGSEE